MQSLFVWTTVRGMSFPSPRWEHFGHLNKCKCIKGMESYKTHTGKLILKRMCVFTYIGWFHPRFALPLGKLLLRCTILNLFPHVLLRFLFFGFVLRQGLHMLPRLVSNSWTQVINPASAFYIAGTTRTCHHAQLYYLFSSTFPVTNWNLQLDLISPYCCVLYYRSEEARTFFWLA